MAKERKMVTTPEGPGGPGGVDLPSNNFMDAVCGALGALAYGDGAIKNQSDLMGAVGQKSKLYSILESLSKNNQSEDKTKLVNIESSKFMKDVGEVMTTSITDPLGKHILKTNEILANVHQVLSNTFDFIKNEDLSVKISNIDSLSSVLDEMVEELKTTLSSSENKLNIELGGNESLKDIFVELKNKDIEALSENVTEIIDSLSKLEELNVTSIQAKTTDISKVVDELVQTMSSLEMYNTKDVVKTINAIASVTKSISNITEIDDNKIETLKNTINKIPSAFEPLKELDTMPLLISSQGLGECVKSLTSEIKIDDKKIKTIETSLESLNKLFGDNEKRNKTSNKNKSFGELVRNVSDICSNAQQVAPGAIESLKGITQMIDLLIQIINQEKKKVNRKALDTLIKITDPKNGQVKQIINNIQTIGINKDTKNAIDSISKLFGLSDSFEKMSNIGFFANIRLKRTLKTITKYLTQNIESLVNSISEIGKKYEPQAEDALNLVNNIFSMVTNISSAQLSSKDAFRNMYILKSLLIDIYDGEDSLLFHYEQLIDRWNGLAAKAPEGQDASLGENHPMMVSLNSIFSITDKIKSLSDFNLDVIYDLEDVIDEIMELIGTSGKRKEEEPTLRNLIISLNKLNFKEKTIQNIESIETIFDPFDDLIRSLPTYKEIIDTSFKVELLMDLSKYIVEFINSDIANNYSDKVMCARYNVIKTVDIIQKFTEGGELGIQFGLLSEDSINEHILKTKKLDNLILTLGILYETIKSVEYNSDSINNVRDIICAFSPSGEIGKYLVIDTFTDSVDNIKSLIGVIYYINMSLEELGRSEELVNNIDTESFDKIANIIKEFTTDGHIGQVIAVLDIAVLNKFNELIKPLKEIEKAMDALFSAVVAVGLIGKKDFENLQNTILDLGVIFSSIDNITPTNIERIKQIIDSLNELAKTFEIIGNIGKMAKLIQAGTKVMEAQAAVISNIFDALSKIDATKVQGALLVIREFARLMVISAAVLLFGSLVAAVIDFGSLLKFSASMAIFMFMMSKCITKFTADIAAAKETLEGFAVLILASAFVLILGGLAMKIIDFGELFKFAITLAGFMLAITLPIILMGKYVKPAMGMLDEFGDLIVKSAVILIVGGLAMHLIDFADLLLFAGTLFLFVTAMTLPFFIFSKVKGNTMESLHDFGVFLVTSAAVLILGSLIMSVLDIVSLVGFTVTLATFILAVISPFMLFGKIGRGAMKGMKEFSIFLITSAAVLILGSLIMPALDMANLTLFTVTLAGFILAVTFAVNKNMKNLKKAMKGLKQFSMFLITTSVLLVLGSLLMGVIDKGNLLAFTVTLAGFIFAVTWSVNKNSKNIQKAVKPLLILMGCVAIAATILLLGGYVMGKVGAANVALFGVILAGFVTAMILALRLINSGDKQLMKGVICLGLLMVVCTLAGAAMGIAAMVVSKYDWASILIGVGLMSLTLIAVAGIAIGLGAITMTGIGGAALWAGVGVLAAVAGIALMAGTAMLAIASAMEKLKKVGKIDTSAIIQNIMGFMSLGAALVPIGTLAPIIMLASVAMTSVSLMMSQIAKAVQEYAELKIPIYEGTKVSGYRHLSKKDFEEAANNVKTICMVLGKAVIDVYDMNPDIFKVDFFSGESKFSVVSKSLSNLGKMIAKIAEGVKDYAELKVPVYKGTEVSGYKSLTNKDFEDAANNVKLVITTLADAVISVYDMRPEMFALDGPFAFLGKGESKFDKVMRSCGNLGNMISQISAGIKDYADLKFAIDWNSEGKPIKFQNFVNKDFENAANNIKLVITTLADAVLSVYDMKPEMFAADGPLAFLGKGESKFDKVMRSCGNLGKMISQISDGIKDYADLKFAIEWNNEGKAIKFKNLQNKDFENAANNVALVITTLADAVISVYDKKPEMFEESAGVLGIGAKKSKFSTVMKACGNLGKMISEISAGIKDYADLKYAIDWNSEGKAIKFKNLENKDFKNAGDNIALVITTLAQAVMDVYDKKPEMFEESAGVFGIGAKKSKFGTVMKACGNLGKMASEIAMAIKDYADLKFPIKWNSEGKAIEFKKLPHEDIKVAGDNLGTVLKALAQAVIDVYDNNKEMFEDVPGGMFSSAKPSKFSTVMNAIGGLGKLVTEVATGVQSFADLKFANQWDDKGNAIGYKTLSGEDLTKAGENIGAVIKCLSKSIIEVYESNPDMFSGVPGGLFDSDKPSKFTEVMTAIGGLGKLVADIAGGLQTYSEMKFADKWDANGNPISFKEITPELLSQAAFNIGEVIKCLSKTIIDVYDQNPEMFQGVPGGLFENDKPSKFTEVMTAIGGLGGLIGGIAGAVNTYAQGKMAIDWDEKGNPIKWIPLGKEQYKAAGEAIASVIETMALAVIGVYERGGPGGIFRDETVTTGKWIFKKTKSLPGTSPFAKTVNALGGLSGLIEGIGGTVADLAMMQIPDQWNAEGKAIHYIPLGPDKLKAAGKAVADIISLLAKSIVEVSQGATFSDLIKAKALVVPMLNEVSTFIGRLGRNLRAYSVNSIYLRYDKDGNGIGEPIEIDYDAAAATAARVCTTLANAMVEVAHGKWSGTIKKAVDAGKVVGELGQGILPIAKALQIFSIGKVPVKYDNNGNPIEYVDMDFDKAAATASDVVSLLANTVVNLYNGKGMSGGRYRFILSDFTMAKKTVLPLITETANTLTPIANALQVFGMGKVATKFDGEGNPTEYTSIDFDKAATTVSSVISLLASTIVNLYNGKGMSGGKYKFVLSDFTNAKNKVLPLISETSALLAPLAMALSSYGRNKVPTKFNDKGDVIEEKSIDFVVAALNAGFVLNTLPSAVVKVAQGKSITELAAALVIVVPLIDKIKRLLSPLAMNLYAYGRNKIPTKFNNSGEIIEEKNIDFILAGINAGFVLNTLPEAVVKVTQGKSITELAAALILVAPLIDKIKRLLSPLAMQLYCYGRNKIPTKFNDNGEIIEERDIDFILAGINAGFVLNTLPEAVVKVAQGKTVEELSNALNIVVPILERLKGLLGGLALSLFYYGIGELPTKFDKDGNPIDFRQVDFVVAGETAGNTIKALMDPIAQISKEYNWDYWEEEADAMYRILRKIVSKNADLAASLYMYAINEVPIKYDNEGNVIESKIIDFVKAGETAGNTITALMDPIAKITKKYNWDYWEEESTQMFKVLDSLILRISKIGSVLRSFSLNMVPTGFDGNNNPKDFVQIDYNQATKTVETVLFTLCETFKTLNNKYSDVFKEMQKVNIVNLLLKNITTILKITKVMEKIKTPTPDTINTLTYIDICIGLLNNMFDKTSVLNSVEILLKADYLEKTILILSRIAKIIDKVPDDSFDRLSEGIDKVNESISKIPKQKLFRENQQILSKYIKQINTLDIKKVNSLTNLINSMNILGYKMGNLDNLTKVLAHQISDVLKKLTQQLEVAAKTIKDADKLQKYREQSINKSIGEITNLLGQTMKVEISQSSAGDVSSPGAPSAAPGADTSDTLTIPDTDTGTPPGGNTEIKIPEGSAAGAKGGGKVGGKTERISLDGYVIKDGKGKKIGTISRN